MSEEMILQHCSPTLAGLKTGNLFSCPYTDQDRLFQWIRELNKKLVPKGLRLIPLRVSEKNALIYLYRQKMLEQDLAHATATTYLSQEGYCVGNCARCVLRLRNRLCQKQAFPHEIGFFLGYPPEDVVGFIENQAENYKCVGCWKVYGDEENARREFERYRRCTSVYMAQWRSGISIERLTVAG